MLTGGTPPVLSSAPDRVRDRACWPCHAAGGAARCRRARSARSSPCRRLPLEGADVLEVLERHRGVLRDGVDLGDRMTDGLDDRGGGFVGALRRRACRQRRRTADRILLE